VAVHDFNAQRLFVEAPLDGGAIVRLDGEQANYLINVLRLKPGDAVHVFNGRDGEWRARLVPGGRRDAALACETQVRPQHGGPDLDYVFAPLKRSRLDYMVQKAVEMGAARLVPVLTRRTVAERVNLERMRANAIEAAEQCGILRIPEIAEPRPLAKVAGGWPADRGLVFCDEGADIAAPVEALRAALASSAATGWGTPPRLAVLVGPEGGFDEAERRLLLAIPGVIRMSLGQRIIRADTAAVAALALVNAVAGDWR
jgi:16S rRNA (uracil1498-N3)-methyltransferase